MHGFGVSDLVDESNRFNRQTSNSRGVIEVRGQGLRPVYRDVTRVITAVRVNSVPLTEGSNCQVPP